MGWGLSVPGVSRKTSKGVPLYDDAKDTFILSGAEDLVAVEKLEARTCYRPRTEGNGGGPVQISRPYLGSADSVVLSALDWAQREAGVFFVDAAGASSSIPLVCS